MKRTVSLSIAVLFCGLLIGNLQATDTQVVVEGRILAVEPSESITILITKSKGIVLSLAEIQKYEPKIIQKLKASRQTIFI